MIQHKDVEIIPYRVIDGRPTLPDDFFSALYGLIVDEGALGDFYALTRGEDIDEARFTSWCKANHFYLARHKGIPVLFIVVTEIRPGFGFIDLYHFHGFRGTAQAHELRRQVAECLLNSEWNAWISFVPASNPRMAKSLHKIPWETLGVIPKSRVNMRTGEKVDTLVGFATADMYRGQS